MPNLILTLEQFDVSLIGRKWKIESQIAEPATVDFEKAAWKPYPPGVSGRRKLASEECSGGGSFITLLHNWTTCAEAGKPKDSVLEILREKDIIGEILCFPGIRLIHHYGTKHILALCFHYPKWYWTCHNG